VDYTKSIVEVYIDFVNYSMEAASAGDKLSFLGHCSAVLYQEETCCMTWELILCHHGYLIGEGSIW